MKEIIKRCYDDRINYHMVKNRILELMEMRVVQDPRLANGCSKFSSSLQQKHAYIDTTVKYTVCNLYDSRYNDKLKVKEKQEYCSKCRFKNLAACYPCPNSKYEDTCNFKYEWAKLMEWHFKNFVYGKYKKI